MTREDNMDTKAFEDFFNHDEVVVQDAAKFLAEVEHRYKENLITASEFEELSNDALEIGDINDLADDLDRRVAISEALDALKIIAGFVI